MANKAVVDVLTEAWSLLTYREREMLKLKFGLGDNYVFSNEEIGRVFHLGAARVGQLLRAASKKLDAKTKSVQPEPPYGPRHGADTRK